MIKCSWIACEEEASWKQTDEHARDMFICHKHYYSVRHYEPNKIYLRIDK